MHVRGYDLTEFEGRVRVALFTVHMLNRGDDEISRRNREAYLDAVRPLVQPVAHVFFPGKIDPERLSLFDRPRDASQRWRESPFEAIPPIRKPQPIYA